MAGERRLRSEVAETTDQLRAQERRLQQVTDRARRFSEAQGKFSQLQGTATGLAAGGMASIGTGMAIAAPLMVAVEGSMEFQSVMTDINQKVNQSREAGRLMGLELQKAALSINQFPADLQKGVDTLTGFGLGARDAVNMMTPIGRAATAYKAEIDDLGKASFAAHDNLKVPINQTAKAIDVMAQAGKSGAFEVKDMAQYFPELTANMQSLKATGIPAVADLAAALQIVRKGAGDSAGAATNLTNLLSKINAGDTAKNFAKFGIDVPAAMRKAAKEGRSPIEEIVRLTQKATGGDQAKLSSLFGDMQVQQALRPLMSAFSEYQSIRDDAMAANGTVNTDFADRMNDDAEKVKRLQIQAKNLSTTVGDQLRPMVGDISDRFSKWGSSIAAVAERHPNLTRAAAVAAGVLAALFIVVGGGAIVLATLVAPFAALSAAATLLGIGLLPLIGIAAGVVLGIGALAAGAYLIYANWGGITAWLGGIWSEITGYFSGGIAGITAFLVNFSPMGLLYGGSPRC
ncbi:phage tail tape measure protein [Sphingobium sp. DC-2]|uniref:phage tail tape measure protein n=1 Tax=Sphingobium sp. DC-2 TaxID=1303256 RepID=UPI000A87F7F3|nr:phage tail tape measure protein [Sphingobium sp. DC-2]